VVGTIALDESHGLAQAGDVGAENPVDEFIYRVGAPCYTPQVGVDHRLCGDALIDLEPHIGWVVLRVVQMLFVDVHISGFE
jgi:hypothetical protein